MKRIGIYLFVLALAISSCEPATEFDRDFIIEADGAITSLDGVERLLAGAYEAIPSTSVIQFNAYSGDNLQLGPGNRGQGIQAHSWQLDSTDGLALGLWNGAYNVIDQVNRTIDALNALEIEDEEEDRRDSLLGELLAIRGYMHFELFRGFTPDYDSPDSPSAIVINETIQFDPDDVIYLERNNAGEVLGQVNSDLEEAFSLLGPLSANRFRFSSTSVRALQARVKLYENTSESLQLAIDYATDVIETQNISGPDVYFNLFRNDISDGSELLFGLPKDVTDAAIGTLFTDTNNDIFFEVSDDLVFGTGGLLEASNTDVRFPLILDFETTITPDVEVAGDVLPVGKYVGRSAANPALQDHKILRTSEMYLIRAEANAIINGGDGLEDAQEDIEILRSARVSSAGTPEYNDQATALTDIANERRLELAYEGHRLYDLKRTGTPIERPDSDCQGTTPCTLPATSGRFILPIPQDEIFANEALGPEDQNPDY